MHWNSKHTCSSLEYYWNLYRSTGIDDFIAIPLGGFLCLIKRTTSLIREKASPCFWKALFNTLKCSHPWMIQFISSFSKAQIHRASPLFKYPDNFYTKYLSLVLFASKELCKINDYRIITRHFQTNGRKSSEVSGCLRIWAHNHLQSSTKMYTRLRFTFMACTIIVWLFCT